MIKNNIFIFPGDTNMKNITLILTVVAGALLTTQCSTPRQTNSEKEEDLLAAGFTSPPEEARPRVWWHWMNGNITWEGAKADMDWMKRIGIGGLQSFDAGMQTPQVVDERLPYMSEGWKEVFGKTASYADELGLELGIAASPGWSETGGPWVQAEDAMKKMVWSVTPVTGGRPFSGSLEQPPTTTGAFQSSIAGGILGGRASGQTPPEYYEDQKVVAFRVPDDAVLPAPVVTASAGNLDPAALSDGDLSQTAIDLPASKETGGISWIQFDYGEPVTLRGLTFSTDAAGRLYFGMDAMPGGGAPPTRFRLEASNDSENWRDTGANIQAGSLALARTISVDNVSARYFRFTSETLSPAPPRALGRWERPTPPPPDSVAIKELVLRGEATVHSFEEKAGFFNNGNYFALPEGTAGASAAISTSEVIDLTDKMSPGGHLDWQPTEGNWLVLRIGYSLTGAMNRPASPEATGLEVDKLNRSAVRRYMDHYLSMYRDATDGMLGERGLQAMMFDSWEASNANWTPLILDDFMRLHGYDPVPWLPALAGYVVESPERSDAFLFDWRRTIQQLLKENHYELLTGVLHDIGMIRYGEAHEAIFSTMGDGMEMKQSADIPMGAMWLVNSPEDIEAIYFNDIQESASVAHIYGQNIAATESFTGGPPYGSAPWDLKTTADAILLAGSNRFVIHTSAHQPVTGGPGMTLGVGQFFSRNETWAEQAKPWIDYLSRSSYMLQQGKAANDIAVFYGEGVPLVASYFKSYPDVPEGYRYDYVNADVIRNKFTVKDGKLVTDSGMAYSTLFFGNGTERVTLAVLKSVLALVRDGAVLVGRRPEGSPSLADDPVEVKAILDTLWPGAAMATVGKGRVFDTTDLGDVLETVQPEPDFSHDKPMPDSHLLFLHRHLSDGEAYFVASRVDRAETIDASFRVTGFKPELWDPATGKITDASYRFEGERTVVTIPFDRFGSVFVVFRKPTTSPNQTVPVPELETITTLEGPWEVAFQEGRGAPPSASFDTLMDFRDHSDPGIQYFSGVASYSKQVEVPATSISGNEALWLDLGQVHNLAEVWVNGEYAGTAWKPPYLVDISKTVRPGTNEILIKSVNLWVNRMIGDAQPDAAEKITIRTSAREFYRADSPLIPSGLLGPVRILQ